MRFKRIFVITIVFLAAWTSQVNTSIAATLPSGFSMDVVANNVLEPTAMEFAPDGRLFVSQKKGQLRVIKNGILLAQPFLTVDTDYQGEHGLIGITFDPSFNSNSYLYIYYIAKTPTIHARVSRFTAAGDTAIPGSEKVLLDLDDRGQSIFHVAGDMHFGKDGKLYIAAGDNAGYPNLDNAQRLTSTLGKLLRINSDGSIPQDNPYVASTTGINQSIWAYGLRNPFTFSIQPETGRIYINDVGADSWEEINDATLAGGNFGWPNAEGMSTNPQYINPIFTYPHSDPSGQISGCAITGGTFYNPIVPQFPQNYVGQYFFADYCSNWISTLDPATGKTSTFATDLSPNPVYLKVGPDGALYYSSEWLNSIYRISYAPNTEAETSHATGLQVTMETPQFGERFNAGQTIHFSGSAKNAAGKRLPASALTWEIYYQHDSNLHLFLPPMSGITKGDIVAPNQGDTSCSTYFRVVLTAKDSDGQVATVSRDLYPHQSIIYMNTSPIGLQVTLDGRPMQSPSYEAGVVGFIHTLGVISPQVYQGVTYEFSSWSDEQPATHDFTTSASSRTFTAVFTVKGSHRSGTIVAKPNPIPTCDDLLSGITTLEWDTKGTTAVEVHIGAPNGNLLKASGPGKDSFVTGRWVGDGSTFFLQDVSNGLPLTANNTLATVTVNLSLENCPPSNH